MAVDLLRKTLLELENDGIIVGAASFETLKQKEFYELEDAFKVYINHKEAQQVDLYKETIEFIIRRLSQILEIEEDKLITTVTKAIGGTKSG